MTTDLDSPPPAGAFEPTGSVEPQARYRLHAEICKVLTDSKRLMLIEALRHGSRSVGALAAEAGLSLANASQHLAVLRHAGLVETRRSGTTVHYRLTEPELVAACDLIDRIVNRRLGLAEPEG